MDGPKPNRAVIHPGHRHRSKGNHVKTQQEGGRLQAKEKGFERNNHASTLISGHPTSKTVV